MSTRRWSARRLIVIGSCGRANFRRSDRLMMALPAGHCDRSHAVGAHVAPRHRRVLSEIVVGCSYREDSAYYGPPDAGVGRSCGMCLSLAFRAGHILIMALDRRSLPRWAHE
jgi:hypothetical protein